MTFNLCFCNFLYQPAMPDNGYKLCSVCKPYIMQELFSVCKTYSWYKLLSCRNFAAGVRITACG